MDIHSKYHRALQKAENYHHEHITVIRDFLADYPAFAQAHNDIAVLFFQSGDKVRALAHLEKAVKLQPDCCAFLTNLADFYAGELGWNNEAEVLYEKVLHMNTNDIEALLSLAAVSNASGKRDTALSHLERVLHRDPANQEARALQQQILSAQPAFTQAQNRAGGEQTSVKSADVSAATTLEQAEKRYVKATELAGQGNEDEALFELESLVRENPNFAPAFNDLGVIYTNRGENSSALQNYEKALALQPKSTVFRRNLADFCYMALSNKGRALKLYSDLIQDDPQDCEALLLMAMIYRDLLQFDETRHYLSKVFDIDPANETAQQIMASLNHDVEPISSPPAEELHQQAQELAAQGQITEALALLESLVATYGGNATVFNDMGVLSYALEDVIAAQSFYEKAVAAEPGNDTYVKNLADLNFIALGKTDEAIHMYLDILKRKPEDIETLSALACICLHLERHDEAKIFLGKILEIEPWNTEAREQLQQINTIKDPVFF